MDVFGLYVASKDPKAAYDDVALAIQKLLKLNDGIDCEIEPELTFSEFVRAFRPTPTNTQKPEDALPPLSNRRYAVYAAA